LVVIVECTAVSAADWQAHRAATARMSGEPAA